VTVAVICRVGAGAVGRALQDQGQWAPRQWTEGGR
jgi:hypothetical protein